MDNYCWLRVILKNGGIGVCQNEKMEIDSMFVEEL